jgi:hypothetical protein
VAVFKVVAVMVVFVSFVRSRVMCC